MSTQVQFRRGTTAQTASFTGVTAEITVDTTKNTVVVHDGSTAGGFALARESALSANSTFAQAAFTQANAAFLQANTPSYTSNSAASYANSAYAQANAAFTVANNAVTSSNGAIIWATANAAFEAANSDLYSQATANAAFLQANSAFTVANAAFTSSNGVIAWSTANSAASYANSAFSTANSAGSYANSAFLAANTPSYTANSAASYANSAFTRANNSVNANTGGTISGDIIVTGNLTIQGTTFTANAGILTANDTMFVLGLGNYTSDVLDLGFAAHYNAGTNAHSGLIRDSVTKEWYLFKNYTPEIGANNNIDITDASFAIDTLSANVKSTVITLKGIDLLPYVNNSYTAANTPSYTANSAASYANAAFLQANTPSDVANSAASYANSAFLAANTPSNVANSAASYANAAFLAANSASATDATQNASITAAFTTANDAFLQANTPSYIANSASSYANSAFLKANSAFVRANNSLNANTGGTVAGPIVVDNGSYGNVTITQFASVWGQASGPNAYSIVQTRSNDNASGIGMQAYAGTNGLLYANTGIQFNTGANLRDKDYPTGGIGAGQFAANGAFIAQSGIASTSNTSGAIQVVGGVGVKGNVATDGVIFADGTRQTTAASGGATLGDVLALSIALG